MGITQITDRADVFSFEMPDENVTTVAAFNETAMTDFSVATVSYAPNNENTAFAEGISAEIRLALPNAANRTVKYNGNRYTVSDFGIVAIAAKDLNTNAELTLDTSGATAVSSGNSILNENSIYIDYKATFSVTNWSDDYIVRPYITLLDRNRQTLHYLGQSEQINLTAGRTDNNIPHIAESSSGIYSAPAKMICAATDACGVLQYELFYTNGYSTETSCVLNRDGTYRDGSEGGDVTTELIGINRMFASIGDIMAVSAYENMTSFNLNQEREIQQSANLGGYEIGFTVNDSGPYGGVGLAVNDENEHIYLYSSKAASFTVTNAESAGVGYYSDDGWIEVRSANGTFALTDDEAQNGYIIRVTLNK